MQMAIRNGVPAGPASQAPMSFCGLKQRRQVEQNVEAKCRGSSTLMFSLHQQLVRVSLCHAPSRTVKHAAMVAEGKEGLRATSLKARPAHKAAHEGICALPLA